MKKVEVSDLNEYVDKLVNDLPDVDPEDLPNVSTATYQVWLLGYKFNTEGDLEVDDYTKFISERSSKSEAKQVAVSIKNNRLTLDTDSDVVMVQVQTVVEVEEHGELCIGVDYEAQVEFMKGKEE